MKKKLYLRSLLGFPLGLSMGYVITILISLFWADGAYVPCTPALIAAMGSEINAVLLQAFLCGVLGAGFAAASVIWEIDDWGLVKQTGIYFFLISVLMLPIAYLTHWMEHSVKGVLSYFGLFLFILAVVWVVQYKVAKSNVKKWNAILEERQNGKQE